MFIEDCSNNLFRDINDKINDNSAKIEDSNMTLNEDDPCISKPCFNNSCQISKIDNYTCNCVDDFSGKHCESRESYCRFLKPCLNGGSCKDSNFFYECSCVVGFIGQNCSDSKLCNC